MAFCITFGTYGRYAPVVYVSPLLGSIVYKQQQGFKLIRLQISNQDLTDTKMFELIVKTVCSVGLYQVVRSVVLTTFFLGRRKLGWTLRDEMVSTSFNEIQDDLLICQTGHFSQSALL